MAASPPVHTPNRVHNRAHAANASRPSPLETLHQTAQRAWHAGLDFLFPPTCPGCKNLGWSWCPVCAQAVLPMPPSICQRCGRVEPETTLRCAECRSGALPDLSTVRSAAAFAPPLRAAIHALKYWQRPDLAEPLARYLVTVFAFAPWQPIASTLDLIVPVPLHPQREAERGYNQATVLAQAFCRQVNLPCLPHALDRIRATRPQVGLDRAARQANVADAFAVPDPAPVAQRTVLLIDDVFTTGATLQACAHALRQAGAHGVYALTLAAARARPHDAPGSLLGDEPGAPL